MAELPVAYTGVKGFLIPEFTDPLTGSNGLRRHDFNKVAAGYACAVCLAEFTTYRDQCPICGHVRDVTTDLDMAPDLWNEHLAERDRGGPATVARTPDEAIRDLMGSRDIDQIPLSKLKPSRWGRG